MIGTWVPKEGLFEYSIKRLTPEERDAAIERIKTIPIMEDLKRFMKL